MRGERRLGIGWVSRGGQQVHGGVADWSARVGGLSGSDVQGKESVGDRVQAEPFLDADDVFSHGPSGAGVFKAPSLLLYPADIGYTRTRLRKRRDPVPLNALLYVITPLPSQ